MSSRVVECVNIGAAAADVADRLVRRHAACFNKRIGELTAVFANTQHVPANAFWSGQHLLASACECDTR